jgi:hypothetical protein
MGGGAGRQLPVGGAGLGVFWLSIKSGFCYSYKGLTLSAIASPPAV